STASSLTRIKEFGSWSEQYSSSGKRYFYNRETEVSQWEKPMEWREYERAINEGAASHSPKSSSCKYFHIFRNFWIIFSCLVILATFFN
uniref:WW domain-containing protein n=1 Tax=Syphacia muris TaxID=451379 RepID=A0A0N5AE31_9BILA